MNKFSKYKWEGFISQKVQHDEHIFDLFELIFELFRIYTKKAVYIPICNPKKH